MEQYCKCNLWINKRKENVKYDIWYIFFGYIPQIIQIIKTKLVNDLNLKTFMSIFIGVFFMEIYAINLVVTGAGYMFLVTNSMSLVLAVIMCILILMFRKK